VIAPFLVLFVVFISFAALIATLILFLHPLILPFMSPILTCLIPFLGPFPYLSLSILPFLFLSFPVSFSSSFVLCLALVTPF